MWELPHVTSLVAWLVFTYWQPPAPRASQVPWYVQNRAQIRGTPPNWVFGVVWSVLYALVAAAAVLYFGSHEPGATTTHYVALSVLYVLNVLLNKAWTPIFFGLGAHLLAFLVLLCVLASSVAIAVLLGLDGAWISFGLYAAYPAWTLYAAYLNAQWVALRVEKK